MLTNTSVPKINPDAPFDPDPLHLRTCAENLTRLIENSDTPLVMTISAPWGQGKTTFIKNWRALLKARNFTTIYFDAWSNDYADDPLVSFIGALYNDLEKNDADTDAISNAFDKVKSTISSVVKASPKIALNWALRGGLHYVTDGDPSATDEIEAISQLAAKMMTSEIEKQKGTREQIEEFKKALSEYAEAVTTDAKPLIVFIDELDRCRPDYTIELLERIKHLFAVPGVFFVIAVDGARLGQAASKLIGFADNNGANADGYLRRFIDLDFHLPEPDSQIFLCQCIETFKYPKPYDGVLKASSIFLGGIADQLELSLRVQHQVMNRLYAVSSAFHVQPTGIAKFISIFLIISAKHRDLVKNSLTWPYSDSQKLRSIITTYLSTLDKGSTAGRKAELVLNQFDMLFYDLSDRPVENQNDEAQFAVIDFFGMGGVDMAILRRTLWSMMEFGSQFKS